MTRKEIESLLKEIKNGQKSIEDALEEFQNFTYTDMGFARIDHHREIRTGYPEIVYCAGKTIEQVVGIFRVMTEKKHNVIGTRADEKMFQSVKKVIPEAVYYPVARIISIPL
jgi:NCAIR mutase (PurE)-related protein